MSLILGTDPKDGLKKLKNMVQHWEFCYGQNISENVAFVSVSPDGKKTEYSFKEIHARQQCLAAFLVQQGVKKTDVVTIIAENTPTSILSSLSVTYAGAILSLLPADIPIPQLKKITQTLPSKVIIFTSYKLFKYFQNEIFPLPKDQIAVVWTEHYDEISEDDKIITAEIAIELGKNFWREDVALIRSVRENISSNDIYCIEWNRDPKNNFSGYYISHTNYLKAIIRWLDTFKNFPQKSNIGLLKSPAEPHLRTIGVYAAMSYFNVVWFLKISPRALKILSKEDIKVLITNGSAMNLFATWITNKVNYLNWLSKKVAQSGFKTNVQYTSYLDKQLSPPIGIKARKWFSYQYVLRKLKQQLIGKKNIIIITNDLKLRPDSQLILETLGIQVFIGSSDAAVAGFWAVNTPNEKKTYSIGKIFKDIQHILKLDQQEKSDSEQISLGRIILKGEETSNRPTEGSLAKEGVIVSGRFHVKDGFLYRYTSPSNKE